MGGCLAEFLAISLFAPRNPAEVLERLCQAPSMNPVNRGTRPDRRGQRSQSLADTTLFQGSRSLRCRFLGSSPSLKVNGWKRPYIRESATAEFLRSAIARAPAMDADHRGFLDVSEEELPSAHISGRHSVSKDENLFRRTKTFTGGIP